MKERDVTFGAIDLLEGRPFAASTGHCGLHRACRWLGSVPMIPRFAAYAVSLLAVVFLISACASRDEAVIEESTAAPSAPMHNRPVYSPGTEGTTGGHF
jgi:hypothetical protein